MIQRKYKSPETCHHEIVLTSDDIMAALFPTVKHPRPGWAVNLEMEYDEDYGSCLVVRLSKPRNQLAEEADIKEWDLL